MAHAGFTLDLNRCTGCSACRIACELANPVSPGVHWRSVTTFNPQRWSGATVVHWSLACNHCLEPPCLAGCPAGAYSKDVATGAVVLDRDRCLGCRYCSWVCPYAAPQLDSAGGTMEKCTFCLDRQQRGEEPACVAACPTGALGFEREFPPPSAGRVWPPGFPDTGTRPALTVTKRRAAAPPEMTDAPADSPAAAPEHPSMRLGLAAEWPLLVFTLAATTLVAWLTSGLLGGPLPPLPVFLAIGGGAMAVSALHLGRPRRAWRAVLGLRTSWVSREVTAFSLFMATGAVAIATGTVRSAPGSLAVAAGLAALVSVDMVYRVRGQAAAAVPHSAMTTLTWALLVALLVGSPGLATIVAILKVVLYQGRHLRAGGVRSLMLSSVRLVVGLLIPLAFWPSGDALSLPLLGALAVGEVVDRAELYAELAFLTPRRQAVRDLASAVRSRSGSAA